MGPHNTIGGGAFAAAQGIALSNDGEHIGITVGGSNKNKRDYHSYLIYPVGVPLGSSVEARRDRWTSKHVTTADIGFNSPAEEAQTGQALMASTSETLGREIFHWFRTEWQKPIHRCDWTKRVMVYEPATRIVHVYKEDDDYAQSAPEHTFNATCKLPAEKLGLVPTPAFVTP